MEEIKIPLSNKKAILGLIVCAAFIFFCIWFIIAPEQFLNSRRRSELTVLMVGIVGLVFFSITLISILIKLSKKNKGLIIKSDGFFDNSGSASVGEVKWKDVISIEKMSASNQKFVVIIVSNPEDYLNKQKSTIKRMLMSSNNSFFGSPIQISGNVLEIKFEEFFNLMNNQFQNFKSNNS